ncbi:MAG: flagellar biosynthesis anti-sigma factor FlgM [Fervidobacterium sp.]
MIDRINRTNQMQNPQNLSDIKGKGEKRVEKSKVKEPEQDSLVVEEGKKFAQYIDMAKNYPEVRVQLVQQIKDAIEKGSFAIDVEKIAKKLLEG